MFRKKKLLVEMIFLIKLGKQSFVIKELDTTFMRQTVCLVDIPIMVDNFAAHFHCTKADRASDLMMTPA